MPSQARVDFDKNLTDVNRLFVIYAAFTPRLPGVNGGLKTKRQQQSLEVLNRSMILLINSMWEVYCEDVVAEAVLYLATHARTWEDIPVDVKKRMVRDLEKDKSDLAAWKLADNGWRKMLEDRVKKLQNDGAWGVNTPNSDRLDAFFRTEIGVAKISAHWTLRAMSADDASSKLNEFVTLRGEIAHRARSLKPISKKSAKDYLTHIRSLVEVMDTFINLTMQNYTGVPLWPGHQELISAI